MRLGVRISALLVCVGVAGALAPGCTCAQMCAPDTRPPGDAVVVLVESSADRLDPRFWLSAYASKIGKLIFAGLVRVGPDLAPAPDLASGWEQPDPRTYVFTLRDGVRFHDGTPVTAADVVYTFESILDPAQGSPIGGNFKQLERVEADGERRVRFTLRAPYAPFLTDLATGIVPRARAQADPEAFRKHPIGAGPFRFEAWPSDDEIVLSSNPQWWEGAPRVPRLVFRTVRDDTARLQVLLGGGADLVQNALSPLLVPVIRRAPALHVESAPSTLYTYLAFNVDDPILRDVRVRQAVALAIDRAAIVERKFAGRARLATGLLAPEHWAYSADVDTYAFDPARARALLDAAGHPDPDGDGPLPRFTLVYKTSTNRFRVGVARALAAMLEDVGIHVELRPYEWATFFEDVKSGNFQLCTLQWNDVIDPDLYRWIFHSENVPPPGDTGRGANRGRYRDAELDALLDAGRAETDRAKRREIYAQVQRRVSHELPYVSLWYEDNIAVRSTRLTGYPMDPGARFDGLRKAALTAGPRSAEPPPPANP